MTTSRLGRERLDELVALRAFDGLSTDDILAIGHEQLAANRAARAAAAREIDPDASEAEVLARVKADHPTTFEGALAEYRDVMDRARAFIAAERLDVAARGCAAGCRADAQVPAPGDALRGLLRAGGVRPAPARASTS